MSSNTSVSFSSLLDYWRSLTQTMSSTVSPLPASSPLQDPLTNPPLPFRHNHAVMLSSSSTALAQQSQLLADPTEHVAAASPSIKETISSEMFRRRQRIAPVAGDAVKTTATPLSLMASLRLAAITSTRAGSSLDLLTDESLDDEAFAPSSIAHPSTASALALRVEETLHREAADEVEFEEDTDAYDEPLVTVICEPQPEIVCTTPPPAPPAPTNEVLQTFNSSREILASLPDSLRRQKESDVRIDYTPSYDPISMAKTALCRRPDPSTECRVNLVAQMRSVLENKLYVHQKYAADYERGFLPEDAPPPPPPMVNLVPYPEEIECNICCETKPLNEFSPVLSMCACRQPQSKFDHSLALDSLPPTNPRAALVAICCQDCFGNHLKAAMEADELPRGIRCPTGECIMAYEKLVHLTQESFIGNHVLARYAQRLRTRACTANTNWRHCSTPNCHAGKVGDPSMPKMKCTVCQNFTCFKHRDAWHTGVTCEQYDALGEKRAGMFLSTSVLEKNTKRCPGCQVITWKDGGCNHMRCSRCSVEWFWCCGRLYRDEEQARLHRQTC